MARVSGRPPRAGLPLPSSVDAALTSAPWSRTAAARRSNDATGHTPDSAAEPSTCVCIASPSAVDPSTAPIAARTAEDSRSPAPRPPRSSGSARRWRPAAQIASAASGRNSSGEVAGTSSTRSASATRSAMAGRMTGSGGAGGVVMDATLPADGRPAPRSPVGTTMRSCSAALEDRPPSCSWRWSSWWPPADRSLRHRPAPRAPRPPHRHRARRHRHRVAPSRRPRPARALPPCRGSGPSRCAH